MRRIGGAPVTKTGSPDKTSTTYRRSVGQVGMTFVSMGAILGSGWRQSGVRIWAHGKSSMSTCSSCGVGSRRVHSRYHRRLADMPVAGSPVVLWLRVRWFFCDNPRCSATTFAEQVEGLTSPHARRSRQLRGMLESIGLAVAARAGARLADRLGVVTGRDTLLRLVRGLPDPTIGTVTVLGVDDFAFKRRATYGRSCQTSPAIARLTCSIAPRTASPSGSAPTTASPSSVVIVLARMPKAHATAHLMPNRWRIDGTCGTDSQSTSRNRSDNTATTYPSQSTISMDPTETSIPQ